MPSDFDFELTAPAPRTEPREVYTPTRLNREARTLLERGFGILWVEGELSNLSRPSSGHWYFSLKDASAQLRCAMFRQRNILIRFTPKDGMRVQVRGRVSLYEARGDYQFLVDHIEEAGEGALRRRFEELKAKLAAEGLFAAERKRPLPKLPRRIGVITSPTGAAIRDVLHILRRRFCSIPVLVYPVQVQGAGAARQIAATIRLASARAECDVLILARGGGSLEDLWAFNEEIVARAIYDCAIPIVSGVGHEIDFTIADFVADVRAPTPSGAAELVAPDCADWLRTLASWAHRLRLANQRNLAGKKQRLVWLQKRLAQQHPGIELRQHAQRLDELEQRLTRAMNRQLADCRAAISRHSTHLRHLSPARRLALAQSRLAMARTTMESALRRRLADYRAAVSRHEAHLRHLSPARKLAAAQSNLEMTHSALKAAMHRRLDRSRNRFELARGKLNAVSPLATLERGYAIVTTEDGHVVTDSATLTAGRVVRGRLARGTFSARVEQTFNDSNKDSSS